MKGAVVQMSERLESAAAGQELAHLRDLVAKHKICWEVWPECHQDRNGRKIQIGFELDLVGTHYQPSHLPNPGCDECVKVYNALWEIAVWILPQEKRLSRYEIQIFDHALRYTPSRKLRPEVTLALKILHAEEFDRPVDVCEQKCLNEMQQKLRQLGALQGRWQPSNNLSKNEELLEKETQQ